MEKPAAGLGKCSETLSDRDLGGNWGKKSGLAIAYWINQQTLKTELSNHKKRKRRRRKKGTIAAEKPSREIASKSYKGEGPIQVAIEKRKANV